MPFFSKNTRFFGPTYCRPEFRMPEKSALSRCGILPHSREERQDAAAPPSCEVNDSISLFFEVLPEVAIRQRLTVLGRSFFGHQISKIPLFLSPSRPSHPPMARGLLLAFAASSLGHTPSLCPNAEELHVASDGSKISRSGGQIPEKSFWIFHFRRKLPWVKELEIQKRF
jgi:hypothetical protein